jgi:protein-S-isoprenylcysteine O-methyltransferase Ste14
MATVALVLYAVWAGTAFGLRMIIQLRRTGDTGFRGQAPRPGSAEWWARLLFVAALGLGVAAPVAARTGLDTFDVLDTSAFAVVGVALAALGIAGTLWAQLAMGDSWRIGVEKTERTDLVIGGLFGLVRNPIFTTPMRSLSSA